MQFDRWIKNEYNNPPVIVTENGWSDEGELNDKGRVEYLHDHLVEVLNVVLNDECDLKAYTSTCYILFSIRTKTYFIFGSLF